MILTNKHFVAALIVTPILAILGYFAVDIFVSEKPQAAEDGSTYPLVAKPNCRYTSGHCEFKNGALDINIEPTQNDDGTVTLALSSSQSLQSAQYAVADKDQANTQPTAWTAANEAGTEWTTIITSPAPDQQLQLVINASDSIFYGETELVFVHYETSFHEDFRKSEH